MTEAKAVYVKKEEFKKAIGEDPKRVMKVSIIADRVNVKIDGMASTSYFCSMDSAEGRAEKDWLVARCVEGKASFVLYDKNAGKKFHYVDGEVVSVVDLPGGQQAPRRAVNTAGKDDIFAEGRADEEMVLVGEKELFWDYAGIRMPVNTTEYPAHIKACVPKENGYVPDDSVVRRALSCLMNGQPLLLEGHSGVGKTEFIKWLAHNTNNPLLVLQGSEDMETAAVLGHLEVDDKGTYWVDGLLTTAVKHGFWLYFDEINAVPAGVKIALHGLLDDSRYLVLADHEGERITAHRNFRMIAACNPADHGAYCGAGAENLAFLNRFSKLHINYMREGEERALLKRLHPRVDFAVISNLVKSAVAVRKEFREGRLMGVVTTRDLKGVCANLSIISVDEALSLVVGKFSPEDGNKVEGIFGRDFGALPFCKKVWARE
jgi:MoxR-like ATPase